MTIEVANKLVKLRKENGLSQEELASKLGISRQAVSKWERAEASPDTDNLICLAKLYNVSLDDLLKTDETVEEIKEDQLLKNNQQEIKEETLNINGEEVKVASDLEITGDNIKVKSDGKIRFIKSKEAKAEAKIATIVCSSIMLISLIVYVLLSVFYDSSLWGWLWVILLIGPVISSVIDVFYYKNIKKLNIVFIAIIVYIPLGMLKDLWHPGWVVFLIIPVFYIFATIVNNIFGIKDDDEDNDEDEDDEDNDED